MKETRISNMKKMMLFVTMILICLTLQGCTDFISNGDTSDDEGVVSAALVIRMGKCLGMVSVDDAMLKATIDDLFVNGARVSVVRCDGMPEIVSQFSVNRLDTKGLSEYRAEQQRSEAEQFILSEINKCRPVYSQVDTLQAINVAACHLQNSRGKKIIIVVDSGLGTAGYLDFTKGLLNADTGLVIDLLKKASAIPELSGIQVVWLGCGKTAAPQEPLSETQIVHLREIWQAVLTEAGATVKFYDALLTAVDVADFPDVALVEVESRTIEIPEDVLIDEVEVPILDTVVLDSSKIRFVGDKAVFVDREEASKELYEVAKTLILNPQNRVLVVGTTAGGNDNAFCRELSAARAEAVKEVLMSYGIDESRMVCIGLTGPQDPFHINDLDEKGKMIEEIARKNRKVMIIDVNSEDALTLGYSDTY